MVKFNWNRFYFGHYYSGSLHLLMASLDKIAAEAHCVMSFVNDPTLSKTIVESAPRADINEFVVKMVEMTGRSEYKVIQGMVVLLAVYAYFNREENPSEGQAAIEEMFTKFCSEHTPTAELRALAGVSLGLEIKDSYGVEEKHLEFARRWLASLTEESE